MKKQTQNIIAILGIIVFGFLAFTYTEDRSDVGGRVMAPVDLVLGVGDSGEALGLTVTFNALVNDYRCPVDVQCIEAGAINTNITLKDSEGEVTANYSSDGVPYSFNGYEISIVGVSPDVYSEKFIDPTSYVVTFNIKSAATGVVDNPDYSGAAGGTVPTGENPCSAVGGTWDEMNSECLGVDANMCQEIGGFFNECASACRNDKNAEVCTMQCVQVCEFK
ncbi:MAG: hypothetical protein KBD26_01405 [Candidatus Pacebacteria bacterium]|nr:hypothetical protein [Candidatus Paceibacterota bacterium]MBP9772466.1 hypothetical protein [Candidatus Paceibacterota bacterium]